MSEKSAAYHEAGHAVAAVASRFHCVYRDVSIHNGESKSPFSVSKRKLMAAGKLSDLPKMLEDPEIAIESAVVFFSGLAAERHYADSSEQRAPAVPASAKNDYEMARTVLKDAKVKTPVAVFETQAAEKVDELWPVITEFAEELLHRRAIDASEATEFISHRLTGKSRAS